MKTSLAMLREPSPARNAIPVVRHGSQSGREIEAFIGSFACPAPGSGNEQDVGCVVGVTCGVTDGWVACFCCNRFFRALAAWRALASRASRASRAFFAAS